MSRTKKRDPFYEDRMKPKAGSHKKKEPEPVPCDRCFGLGYVREGFSTKPFPVCLTCGGTGELWEE